MADGALTDGNYEKDVGTRALPQTNLAWARQHHSTKTKSLEIPSENVCYHFLSMARVEGAFPVSLDQLFSTCGL